MIYWGLKVKASRRGGLLEVLIKGVAPTRMLVNSDTLFTAIITIETSPNMMILLDIVWSSFHGGGSDVAVVAANRQGRLGAHFTFMVNTFEKLWRCSQWCTVVSMLDLTSGQWFELYHWLVLLDYRLCSTLSLSVNNCVLRQYS